MNESSINITMLRVLSTLSETRNFSRAADRLCITQSAISHAIRGLEQAVGVPLVTRGNRGITLTAAGEEAVAHAHRALEAINSTLNIGRQPIEGHLRLALINSASIKIAPATLSHIKRRYPKLNIDVLLGTDQEVALWVERGTADLGISYDPGNCHHQALLEDEFIAISGQGSGLSAGTVPLAELDQKPFILSTGGCAPILFQLFEQSHIQPDIIMKASDMGTLVALVSAGYGISIVPSFSLQHFADTPVTRHSLVPAMRHSLSLLQPPQPQQKSSAAVEVVKEIIVGVMNNH
ncbi:LysR family transcriptional regulator [Gynuella sunshinyii]|uniref:Transcriptional regulator n=1 Tax=Gynuella sunshinyii YC6258 TaxID=1445510 RepID=A0A0C5VQI4_9GAMM|nr:LysR family transcriptional regulator [Gynuella sunshinyii]AJQ95673.1 transcriptional regulator [Gynuella sunshinyii YC6258]